MTVRDLLSRPDSVTGLDRVGDPLRDRIAGLLDRHPVVAGLLRGSWLGHPVHPALVTLPVGSWTAAVVLDLTLRDHRAARRLIGVGIAAFPVAAVTGWADWAARGDRDRRAGLVHAGANVVAAGAMLRSFRLRRNSAGLRAQAWSGLGLAVATASAALGGHIAYSVAPEGDTDADSSVLVSP
ncbi:DUF2231 domain-containing protein [Rhodococcus sp. NPDC003318]|uniref:DUF2231 domain-containing protein n=1 Tax=Rhodococcus sp. NPDC003318 TaxID=3364503 RepID=UPI0036C8D17A